MTLNSLTLAAARDALHKREITCLLYTSDAADE